ncbi:MAG: nucleoside triphosphate pyrophosphohydrolase [Candidatus Acidiferrales bacterium]
MKKRSPRKISKRRARKREPSPRIPLNRRDKLAGEWFAKLVALQARLRGPNGCPWDREQTHASLRKFLIEETYEVLDAMESSNPHEFASELGDLLLQITFHSILAEETGAFTISDVIESIHSKMVRRHPHVFGDAKAKDSAAVLKNWEQIKAAERANANGKDGKAGTTGKATDASAAPESILSGVPRSLPGVLEAYQLTRRAAHIGFDWDDLSGIFEKLDEERREILASLESTAPPSGLAARRAKTATAQPSSATEAAVGARHAVPALTPRPATVSPHLEEEVGDLLFAAVNVARFLGTDPEIALKKANRKFQTRFQWMEAVALAEGRPLADLPRERMEELWNLSKLRQPAEAAHTK